MPDNGEENGVKRKDRESKWLIPLEQVLSTTGNLVLVLIAKLMNEKFRSLDTKTTGTVVQKYKCPRR
ncbi:hypothetical protein P3T76_003256 [Phytophthora citrophthora]|uniref:Uncharacterized protein n=1 Tax=Phytophthora citrophthora TaxID=4793 RepID=A0AAD9LPA6_9STRA|nr:hypothetical protein P3T76_003256 [Phytophthora citrophthora]